MAVTYGFFDSVGGDRKYNADTMSEFYTGICSQGVFQSVDNGLAVSAGTGLTVNVATGRAIIQGHWVKNDAVLTKTISAASATYARIDAVVIRFSKSNRNISIVVKDGTPAASPSAPAMTRTSDVYELCLAYVNVAANATSVTVTDKRSNTSVCGWAAVAQSIDGTYEAMIDDMKTGFDGVVYPTPGDAVRSQFGNSYSVLAQCGLSVPTESWQTGKYISKWGDVSTTNNIELKIFPAHKNDVIHAYVMGYSTNVALIAYGDNASATSGWNIGVLSSSGSAVWAEWTATQDCYVAVSSYYGTGALNPPLIIVNENSFKPVNDDIHGIENYIGVTSVKKSDQISNTGYINAYNGNIESNSSFKYSNPINVSAGDILVFFAGGYLTNVAMISTCDSAGDNRTVEVASDGNDAHLYYYKVKTNGYVIICTNTETINSGYARLYITNNTANIQLRKDLDTANANIALSQAEILDMSDKWVYNSYISPAGEIGTNGGFKRSTPVFVKAGYIVSLYGNGYLTNVAMISTCDSSGSNISVKVVSTDGNNRTYQYTTTEDTYVMVCSGKTNDDTTLSLHGPKSNEAIYERIGGDATNPLLQNQTLNNRIAIFHKIGVIGDSLANGVCNAANGDLADRTYSWIQVIARWEGITGINFTAGGLTTRTALSGYVNPESFASDANKCIAYIIGLGVNDRYFASIGNPNGVELGTTADIHLEDRSQNPDTYYGNYASIICRIIEVQPKAKIFLITNPAEDSETSGYNGAIRYMATIFDNVYIVDLYTYGLEIYTAMKNTSGPYWYNAHSTALGYMESAKHIMSYIDWIIKNNLVAFKDVQFIGTDYHY